MHREYFPSLSLCRRSHRPTHLNEHLPSPENLRQSVDGINSKLRGTKRLDHFECARVDEKYEIEDQMRTLAGFVAEGKFDHVGLSEVTAEQIKRANKVSIYCILGEF